MRVRASGLQHTTHSVGRRDGVTSGGDQGGTNCVAAADGVRVWGACTNVRALRVGFSGWTGVRACPRLLLMDRSRLLSVSNEAPLPTQEG